MTLDDPQPPRHALSAGKLRRLATLADPDGVFRMIAVDQRPPLFRALGAARGIAPEDVPYEEIATAKAILTRQLSPDASAVLVDPVWTHPHALVDIPGTTGLLSTLEDHAFEVKDGERYSATIPGWSVGKIQRSGAAGVKLLVWHRPDLSAAAKEHQDAFVKRVGDACREHDLPFVLEILVYPKPGEDPAGLAWAQAKPERVLESVRHFADDAFGVDLLKLEFPCELKRTEEYASGAFDGVARDAAYDLSEVAARLDELHAITNVPWVLLSAGVGPREFTRNLEMAFAAGACGFLAGRAVWLDALDAWPDAEGVEAELATTSVPYLRQINALAETAPAWWEHPRYGGDIVMADASPSWSRDYPE